MKKLSTLVFLSFIVVILGASCQPADPTDQRRALDSAEIEDTETAEKTTDLELVEEKDTTILEDEVVSETAKAAACSPEGQPPYGKPCCEGLEEVAVDHAFTSCQKIGTKGWEPGGCAAEGEMPYIEKLCCEGLYPVASGDTFLCKKL